ncbi:rhodanese domain containing protein [Zalerion maritima]|uniref:Rhodanese domain containing protein n=1 Tax=Zalerion maritima TaxID=339359 RepID=A0AAD5RSR8_9PEZI|nr:rhodanese domain containing protein [Zalerion maritima]
MATTTAFGQNGLLNNGSRPSPTAAPKKLVHNRNLTDDQRIGKIYSFEDVKAVAGKDQNIVIVDCREPHELVELGRVPGAVNIPIDTAPDSYAISEDEFEDRFGYSRPPKDAHLVAYCRAGVRCHTAAELAKQAGFMNVNEYPGSFNDWVANGGEIERK